MTRARLILPVPLRQHDRAADHLVRVLGVDPEEHRDVDGLVELRELCVRNELHGLREPLPDEASTFAFAAETFLPIFCHPLNLVVLTISVMADLRLLPLA